jgi:hypothetical protein
VLGKSIRGVQVDQGTGGYLPSHSLRRPCLKRQSRSSSGQNSIELPGDHHNVSANASDTEPSKLLANFVADTGETMPTTPGREWVVVGHAARTASFLVPPEKASHRRCLFVVRIGRTYPRSGSGLQVEPSDGLHAE